MLVVGSRKQVRLLLTSKKKRRKQMLLLLLLPLHKLLLTSNNSNNSNSSSSREAIRAFQVPVIVSYVRNVDEEVAAQLESLARISKVEPREDNLQLVKNAKKRRKQMLLLLLLPLHKLLLTSKVLFAKKDINLHNFKPLLRAGGGGVMCARWIIFRLEHLCMDAEYATMTCAGNVDCCSGLPMLLPLHKLLLLLLLMVCFRMIITIITMEHLVLLVLLLLVLLLLVLLVLLLVMQDGMVVVYSVADLVENKKHVERKHM